MQVYNDELYHYGVLGMKWGRRKKTQEPIEISKASKQVSITKEKLKLEKQKMNIQQHYPHKIFLNNN